METYQVNKGHRFLRKFRDRGGDISAVSTIDSLGDIRKILGKTDRNGTFPYMKIRVAGPLNYLGDLDTFIPDTLGRTTFNLRYGRWGGVEIVASVNY